MARNEMKANPAPIISAHFHSFADGASGAVRPRDYGVFIALPLISGGVCFLLDGRFSTQAGESLLTLSGLLGALLFGALLLVSERAMSWADSPPGRGQRTSEQAVYLGRLTANAAYASLVCIATAGVFFVVSVSSGTALQISSALGVALGLHMVLTLLMVIRRVFLFTQARLYDARVGGSPAHGSRRRGGQASGVGSGTAAPR
jgi:hypothetical protein